MFYRSALTTAAVLFLIGASSIFGFLLAYAHVPQTIADFMFSITTNGHLLILIMFFIFLIAGTIMDLTPALIIFVPIFLPIAMQLGMDAIQFGLFIIMSLAIGLYTPPVGAVLFITCGIADISIQNAFKAILPFMIAMIIIVLMVMYIPSITMAIPNMFN